jgi:hypothetical protein
VSTWITGNYLGLSEPLHRNRFQLALSYGGFIAYYLAVGCYRDSIADRRPATLVGGSSSATGSDRSRSGSPASPASRERRWYLAAGAPGYGDSTAARGATSGRVRVMIALSVVT